MPCRIDTIPPEILIEIFLHYIYSCIPQQIRFDRLRDLISDCEDVPNAPYLLMEVCRRWHDIALAEPRLWAAALVIHCRSTDLPRSIAPTYHALASCDAQRRGLSLERLNRRIERSRYLPIDLLIFSYESHNHVSHTESVSLYRAMLNMLPRVRKLHLFVEMQRKDRAVFPLELEARLDEAEVVVLSLVGHVAACLRLGVRFLRHMRRVRDLTLSQLTDTRCLRDAPLTGLTDLVVGIVDFNLFCNVLQQAPALRNVKIEMVTAFGGFPSSSLPFTHDQLRRLDIQRSSFSDRGFWDVLHELTLPNLRTLRLALHRGHHWPPQATVDFFLRSECQLSELSLTDGSVGDKIAEISESLKSLVALHMTTDLSTLALQFLCRSGVLPHLRFKGLLDIFSSQGIKYEVHVNFGNRGEEAFPSHS